MLPNTTKGALLSVTSFTRSVVSFQLSTAFPPRFFSKREALASRSLTLDGLPFSSFVVAERIMCRWKVAACNIKAKRLTLDSSLSFPSGGGVDPANEQLLRIYPLSSKKCPATARENASFIPSRHTRRRRVAKPNRKPWNTKTVARAATGTR
ncbi:hypothetical protein MTR67_039930 [Solanum verrucosum]|uniref:Uncharacterized protein n=1 Tax=Solanum verrucosum TaxID=315347 RepID=A0AAF0UIW5_SOLVR|nr:hypothetical protein MTR67_039930 [Solanum verrucosum]